MSRTISCTKSYIVDLTKVEVIAKGQTLDSIVVLLNKGEAVVDFNSTSEENVIRLRATGEYLAIFQEMQPTAGEVDYGRFVVEEG